MASPLHFLFITLLIMSTVTKSAFLPNPTTHPSYYYNLCAPSTCGTLTLPYPFTLSTPCHPSSIQLHCPTNLSLLLTTSPSADTFRILSIDSTTDPTITTFSLASSSLFISGSQVSSTTGPVDYATHIPSIFSLHPDYTPGTHLNCTAPIPSASIQGLQNASCISCTGQAPSNLCYYAPGLSVTYPQCETYPMYTPGTVFNATGVGHMRDYLELGFQLRYVKPLECRRCETSGGRCGVRPSDEKSFLCFCPTGVHRFNCSDGVTEDPADWVNGAQKGRPRLSKAAIAAISAGASSVLLLVVIIALVAIFVLRQNHRIHFNMESITSISPTRYSYSQLKKFTNNFTSKLGEGGFGCVYKGTIHRSESQVSIAVKILNKSKRTKRQFMNEVATIGSVHHHNLAGMLGYCVDGDTHALVYEFMENGRLDKYIYDIKKDTIGVDNPSETKCMKLTSKQVYNIALETARGILYLHQGCRNSILHCDIKPANVLLDSNFSAKVADFGLARMIEKDHSHISVTSGQGTPGYAAPEMWLTTFGPVTLKSDVYSYGMLLLEMVGRRKNYDPEAADPSQVYFPEWLYNKLERDEFPSLMNTCRTENSLNIVTEENKYEEDDDDDNKKAIQRMCLVGLWCIQYIPSNRPAMDKVVQMLEGHVEIGVPPAPFPQSTATSPKSTTQDALW